MNLLKICLCFTALTCIVPQLVFAVENKGPPPTISSSAPDSSRDWKLSIGGGLLLKRNNRSDNNYEHYDKKIIARPIPYIQGSYQRLSIGHQGISFRVLGNPFINLSTFVNRSGDKYLGRAMSPRKDSVFFGVSGKFGKYNLSISRDTSGRSKGYISQFNYSELTVLTEEIILISSLSLDWYDDRYAEFYYGVVDSEKTATRSEYHPHNFFKPGISVMPIYKIWDRVSLVAALNLKLIPAKIHQSPTMNGKALEVGGLFAINYRF